MKLKTEEKHLQQKIDQLYKRQRTINASLNEQIAVLRSRHYKITSRLYQLKKARMRRCKHDFDDYVKRWNPRDDASFKYWVTCRKCGADIGHIEHDGTFTKRVTYY